MTRDQMAAMVAAHVITRRCTPAQEWERRHAWYGAWLKARQAEDAKNAEGVRRVR